MPTWKLIVEYDGTDFCGWQRQINGPSVQQALEEALSKLHAGESIRATAAGRTDSGVHSRGQTVSFSTPREMVANAYERGLNNYLPSSIAVRGVERVADEFDARRWSRGKRYEYSIYRSRFRSPLKGRFAWQIFQQLDVAAIREAGALLIGRHDFGSFRASNCDAPTTIREMRAVEVSEQGEDLFLSFEATAFLKQMVRNLVGTLVEVGRGKRRPESMTALLQTPDRTAAGPTAPPHGLCLQQVFYDLAAGPPRRELQVDADD